MAAGGARTLESYRLLSRINALSASVVDCGGEWRKI